MDKEVDCYCYNLEKNDFLKEQFRKESLFIMKSIDKDPYIKHITDDPVLNLTGESGSGKSTLAKDYLDNPDCIVIDTDNVFGNRKRNQYEEELRSFLIKKYKELPNLCEHFDEIYIDILNLFSNSNKMLIMDSAQYRNLKDIHLLKGDIMVLRTCVDTCYDRCIKRYQEEHKEATFEDLAAYENHKKSIYQWIHLLNSFLDRLDKEGEENGQI